MIIVSGNSKVVIFHCLVLKVLLRRLRLRLERDSKSGDLIDQSGRYLKMEPLTTIKDLKKHLLKVVSFWMMLLIPLLHLCCIMQDRRDKLEHLESLVYVRELLRKSKWIERILNRKNRIWK